MTSKTLSPELRTDGYDVNAFYVLEAIFPLFENTEFKRILEEKV